jgi:hypothetical protein
MNVPMKACHLLFMKRLFSILSLGTLALTLAGLTGQAQTFTLDWFSIDGGGGKSTGGVYAVTGTIGQPDAGQMSGGQFVLQGGFWGVIAAVQTPGAPLLSISNSSGNVTVSWPLPATDFLLEQTNRLTGLPGSWLASPYAYVTNATTISVTFPPTPGNLYLRLRKP